MNPQQAHEKHEEKRRAKQAEARQAEVQFSTPYGLTFHPAWFWAVGFILTIAALFVWWQL